MFSARSMALITGWVEPSSTEGSTPRGASPSVLLTEHAKAVVNWRTCTETTGLVEPSLRRCAVVAVMQAVHLWNLDDASGRERRHGS